MADLGVHYRDRLVPRAIPCHVEDGDGDAEVPLELLIPPERQPPYPRVQAVRADDEVEVAWRAVLELDHYPVAVVVQRTHRVAEDRLHLAVGGVVDGPG